MKCFLIVPFRLFFLKGIACNQLDGPFAPNISTHIFPTDLVSACTTLLRIVKPVFLLAFNFHCVLYLVFYRVASSFELVRYPKLINL